VPVCYTVDKTSRLIRTRCHGNVTLREVLSHFQALRDDPNSVGSLDVILDLREMTSTPDAEEIRRAARGPDTLRGVLRFGSCAILVNTDVMYGLARMWEMLVEESFTAVVVFKSAAEAEDWLLLHRTWIPSARAY
jgi:hypothetical protein